jgi:hypothetical protein
VAVLIVSEPKVLRYAAVEIPSLTPADNPVDAAFGFPQAEAAACFFGFTPASKVFCNLPQPSRGFFFGRTLRSTPKGATSTTLRGFCNLPKNIFRAFFYCAIFFHHARQRSAPEFFIRLQAQAQGMERGGGGGRGEERGPRLVDQPAEGRPQPSFATSEQLFFLGRRLTKMFYKKNEKIPCRFPRNST